jgi:hypothetical protein
MTKPEECIVSDNLSEVTVMSWKMSNIGTQGRPRIVGWKASEELLKAFFLPERLTNYDSLGIATRTYLGQILVSLYILGYWNLASRRWLESTWRILWHGQEPTNVGLEYVKDFVYKTGLEPTTLQVVSSSAMFPFPPAEVCKLWLGDGTDRLADRYSEDGPSVAIAAAFSGALDQLSETTIVNIVEQDPSTAGQWAVVAVDD